MLETEWQEAWEVFRGLWPQWESKMTDEQAAGYGRQLKHFDQATIIAAMRAFYDEGTSLPKPGSLRDKAKSIKQQSAHERDANGETHSETEQRERAQQEQATMRDRVNMLSDEQIRGHQVMAIAGFPGLKSLLNRDPRKSQLWHAIILERIDNGIGHDEKMAKRVTAQTPTRENPQANRHVEWGVISDDEISEASQSLTAGNAPAMLEDVEASV